LIELVEDLEKSVVWEREEGSCEMTGRRSWIDRCGEENEVSQPPTESIIVCLPTFVRYSSGFLLLSDSPC
jgi:hypothetical protein